MNNKEKLVTLEILNNSEVTQRQIATNTGLSLGNVNGTINDLQKMGFLSSDKTPTKILRNIATNTCEKNAIILAAGYGIRSVPLNMIDPKPLLVVNGEKLIERLIRQLRQAGVKKISVVVGFLKEKFEYLIDEYDVELIVNTEYKELNNIWSLRLASENLRNTYVVSGDVWLADNIFSKNDFFSWYGITTKLDNKSFLKINKKGGLQFSDNSDESLEMSGVAYLTSEVSTEVTKQLRNLTANNERSQEYWEKCLSATNIVGELAYHIIPEDGFVDVNTYEDLRKLDHDAEQLNSEVIRIICTVLSVDASAIVNVAPLKKGMTNKSFSFNVESKKYIMRIPGEGTSELVDRRNEAEVYSLIKEFDYIEDVDYISPNSGYKISTFLTGATSINPRSKSQVRRCLEILKHLHASNIHTGKRFNLYEHISFYEKLWGEVPSIFDDYSDVKQRIDALKSFVITNKNPDTLCHIDANFDNFVETESGLKLIDWEYAGQQDPFVDLAMFAIYAGYSETEIDWLLFEYLGRKTTVKERTLLYSYVAICGLVWSNWCQYKHNLGVEFGEYFMQQFRYAKEYSKKALNLVNGGKMNA